VIDSIETLRQVGFEGFLPVASLQSSRCSEVPDLPGIYLILNEGHSPAKFCTNGVGGYFKGKNPNVPIEILELKWVETALILYVGKAGPGKTATLRTRLNSYMKFGQTKPIGHAGGRYVWQLGYSRDLHVCWKVSSTGEVPRFMEKALIRDFEERYAKLPFANLRH
jgi:hypothetical protein